MRIEIVFRNTSEAVEQKFANELADLCQRYGFVLDSYDKFDLADPEESFNEYFDDLETKFFPGLK